MRGEDGGRGGGEISTSLEPRVAAVREGLSSSKHLDQRLSNIFSPDKPDFVNIMPDLSGRSEFAQLVAEARAEQSLRT